MLRLSSASHFLIVVGFVFRILPNCACERPKAIRASLNFLLSITRISPPQQARRYRPHQYPKSVFHILLNFRSFREEFRNINVHFFVSKLLFCICHLASLQANVVAYIDNIAPMAQCCNNDQLRKSKLDPSKNYADSTCQRNF